MNGKARCKHSGLFGHQNLPCVDGRICRTQKYKFSTYQKQVKKRAFFRRVGFFCAVLRGTSEFELCTYLDLVVWKKSFRFATVKRAWPLLLGLGIFLVTRAAAKVRSVGQYRVSLLSFPQVSILLGTLYLKADLGLHNPTTEKLTLQSVSGEFFVNATRIGAFSTDFPTAQTILPLATTTVPVSAALKLEDAAIALIDFLISRKQGTVIRVKGSAKLHGFSIPFDIETTIQ